MSDCIHTSLSEVVSHIDDQWVGSFATHPGRVSELSTNLDAPDNLAGIHVHQPIPYLFPGYISPRPSSSSHYGSRSTRRPSQRRPITIRPNLMERRSPSKYSFGSFVRPSSFACALLHRPAIDGSDIRGWVGICESGAISSLACWSCFVDDGSAFKRYGIWVRECRSSSTLQQ